MRRPTRRGVGNVDPSAPAEFDEVEAYMVARAGAAAPQAPKPAPSAPVMIDMDSGAVIESNPQPVVGPYGNGSEDDEDEDEEDEDEEEELWEDEHAKEEASVIRVPASIARLAQEANMRIDTNYRAFERPSRQASQTPASVGSEAQSSDGMAGSNLDALLSDASDRRERSAKAPLGNEARPPAEDAGELDDSDESDFSGGGSQKSFGKDEKEASDDDWGADRRDAFVYALFDRHSSLTLYRRIRRQAAANALLVRSGGRVFKRGSIAMQQHRDELTKDRSVAEAAAEHEAEQYKKLMTQFGEQKDKQVRLSQTSQPHFRTMPF